MPSISGNTVQVGIQSNNYFYISWDETDQASSNYTTISWKAYVYFTLADARIYSSYVNINGTREWTGTNPDHAFASNFTTRSVLLGSGSKDIYHNTDGSYTTFTISGGTTFDGGYDSSAASGNLSLTNFVRVPTTPTFASGPTRTVRTADMTLSAVTNYGSGLSYYVDFSKNGGGYTGVKSSTGRSFSFPNLDLGASYVFRGYAADSEGTSGTVTSTPALSIPNVPGIPGPVSVTSPVGRAVTVTTGAAAGNGAAVQAYYAQASADNGVTWGSDTLMSSSGSNFQVQFSSLTGGATYAFRVRAQNEMGYGAYSTPVANIFVPAGGKRYNGSTFANVNTASRRNETNTGWSPLVTTKKYVVSGAITNAVGNGTSVTYTAANSFSASPANKVTVTGVSPTAYNVVNAVVTAATSTSFTVTSSATGAYSSSPSSKAAGWMDFKAD